MSSSDILISIGQNVGKNLHKLVNQRTLGVLADTLTNKLNSVLSQSCPNVYQIDKIK